MSAQKNSIALDALYMSDSLADIHFVFELVQIPAHKAILASKSPVFAKQLNGPKKKYEVQMASATTFMEFLQFFYLNEVQLTIGNIEGVVHLVHKYEVDSAISLCEAYMRETCSSERALLYYDIANKYLLSVKFIDRLEEIICLNPVEILQSPCRVDVDEVTLRRLFASNNWRIKEVVIFEMAVYLISVKLRMRGTEISGPSLRQALGPHLSLIGFPLMQADDFHRCTTQYAGLLTPDEYTDIYQHVHTGRQLVAARHFRHTPRVRAFGVNLLKAKPGSPCAGALRTHQLLFKIDSIDGYGSISLAVIALHSMAKDNNQCKEMRVRIVNTDSDAVECDIRVVSKITENCHPAYLTEPVALQPATKYLLTVDDDDGDMGPVEHKSKCTGWPGFAMTVYAKESEGAIFDLKFECYNKQ